MADDRQDFYRGVLDDHETATVVYEAVREAPSSAIVDFRWMYANKAAQAVLAHPIGDLEGRRVRETLQGELGERVCKINRRVVDTGKPAESVVKVAHQGRDRVFTIRSAKHGDFVITTYRDVSDKVEADKRLSEFATRLDIATRSAGIGVWERDIETGLAWWDAQTRRLHGLPEDAPEEMLGADVDALLHPDDLPRILARVRVGEATGVMESRHRVIHPSGEVRWLQIFARNVTDHRGRRLVGVTWDVTPEVEADDDLRAKTREIELAAQRLSIATEVSDMGVWEFDFSAQKFIWNDQMFAILGADRSRFKGAFSEWRERLHPDDVPAIKDAISLMQADGRDFVMRHRIVRPNGEVRHVRSFGRLVGGRAKGRIIGALIDVTSHVVAAEALAKKSQEAEAASEAKSRFLAAMSHEIRTPMNGVLGMSQALALTAVDERQREMIDLIVRSGESLLSLLNDILDISRIEAGGMPIGAEAFHLGELARDVGALFSARAQSGGLAFAITVEADADREVVGDELRVRQILNNLVSNAIKFTEAGEVRVRIARDPKGGDTLIEVADTGVGIAPDQIERIFEAFVQADDSNTRRFGGSGLGLSIVRRLAEAMGGGVTARSTLRRGSTFTVRLPLLPSTDSQAAGPATEAPEADADARPCRVLVVEDNATNQRVIEAILGSAGVEMTLAVNGSAAIEAWETGGFDVILMDIAMPGMDGMTAARAIRERERETGRERTPIVAVTANVMPHHLDQYREAGMDGYVPKPLDCAKLIEAVRDAVGSPEGARRIA